MTIPLRAGAIAALVLGATPVFAQPIWFTGNVEVDFQGPGVFVIADPPGVDVGVPVQFPAGTISGHDMEDIRLSYDAAADTLYVGFNTYRIGGDVDGDGDPGRTSAPLAAIGGSDRPHFGGTESFTLSIDIDEDGDYDVIVGVSGSTDLSGFTVATFEGSPFAPGFAFGDDLADHIGAIHASPSAAEPHVEFTILRFSELLGQSELDASARFGVNAFMGSFGDAGIGEDHTPGVARTVDICLTPNARDICNDFDDDCDGDIDEDVAGKGDACVVGVGACRAEGHRVCGEANDLVCDAVPGAPTAEACDGIDNDCDGRTDEGIAPRPSQCGQGLCAAAGQITCQGGRLVDSCRPGAPVAERCNADDDDCDGRTDEGIAPTSITCGRGTCASTGVRVCTGGDLIDHCVPGEPESEVCDGLDNDCDGRIDDEIAALPTACGIGACAAAGTATCRDGALTDDCTPGAPRAEVCNDSDDDCDGATDEGIADRPTACGQGACAAVGVLACTDGDLIDSCRPGNPGKEICNGIDDDCDGRTDEGIAPVRTTCGQGACAANGERTCQGGRLVDSCQPGAPGAEICDGIDNDCDGRVDDDIPVEPTACGQGLCAAAGQLICQKGRPVDTCKPGEPGAEVCDGRDDDCDGRVDEGIAPVRTACGQGACAANGERTCQGGRLVDSCQPGAPGAEICDGIDNDCDGRVDDDIPIEPTACGQGLCAAEGKIICENGAPVDTCRPGAPRAEVCDGRDDDCDGRTDEGIAPVRTQCGVGACGATGERTCRDGALVDSCQPGAPGAEQCNGRDDDCDGTSDEGIAAQPTQCGVGACGATGERTCRGGQLVDSCEPGAPRAEVCDGRDDDCDGRTDEGIAPVRTECGTGACGATGERTCQGGRLIDSCQPGAPGAEQCNGRDDDCDGRSDEGIAPRPSNCGQGACADAGEVTCQGGRLVDSCEPGAPVAEQCNGSDDDCDGRTDEGIAPVRTECGTGACGATGERTCQGGRLIDSCQPGAPGAEQCNGRDDDCDGTSDEGIAPRPSNCGQGACAAAGEVTCQGGRLVDSCDPGDPVAEACNGSDDDCDGITDEGIAPVRTECGVGACGATGERACQGGRLIDSCQPGAPGAEQCNGRDDDCDGTSDEGIAPRPSNCGQGACAAAGEVTCQGGRLVDSCDPGDPVAEACNGADDDCDGTTDEGIAPVRTECGTGACGATGERTCQGGRLIDSCQPGAPGAEQCNGRDDDCDGTTDEGIAPRPSNCGQGACAAAGEVTCQGGRLVDSCDPGAPADEVCNDEDDDCDGATDEGIAPVRTECGAGACAATGERTCQGGQLVDSCEPGAPGAEQCNGRDDDCDGSADEGIAAEPTACGEGLCAAVGERTCEGGRLVDSCEPGAPAEELCNDADDDCDGAIDEGTIEYATDEYAADGHAIYLVDFALRGVTRMHLRDDARLVVGTDGTARLTGTAHIVDGPNPRGQEWAVDVTFAYRGQGDAFGGPKIENAPLQPPAVTDLWHYYDMVEGTLTRPGSHVALTQAPADGRYPMQLGIAANGKDGDLGLSLWFDWVRRDADGTGCDGHGDFNLDLDPIDAAGCLPEDEICDDVDNDLDGEIDEGFGVGEPCTVGVGACADEGEVVCGPDGGTVCDAVPGRPGREICNATDDDCDGEVDEDTPVVPTVCGVGACAAEGVIACSSRACHRGCYVDSCEPGEPSAEVCNGIDDDCDGATDEGIAPVPSACGQGACAAVGEVACIGGQLVDSCAPSAPEDEQCNAIDDDCDGDTDEDIAPAPSGCGEGLCAANGEVVCVDGELIDTCLPDEPGDEICNGQDDDCDGETDEGTVTYAVDEYAADGHALWLVDFALPGVTRMHLADGARLVVAADGTARLTGDAFVFDGPNPRGQQWAVDVSFAYRGQGPAFGGPKIENAPLQPPAVTDTWHYYDMVQGTLTRPGSVVTLTQMPADGRYPMQLGTAANGKDGDLGLSLWFTWVRRDADGSGCEGHGDFNLDLDPIAGEGCVPDTELCDDIDNDLDGVVDEGFDLGARCHVGVGACAAEGTVVCGPDGGATCDAVPGRPSRELCDGDDDDCDGLVDEDTPVVPIDCGEGACAAEGVIRCIDGCLVEQCEPRAPSAETCDGQDDDCDGATDEGIVPVASACGAGECAAAGEITCQGGALVDSCDPGEPAAELCNGVDDDCDGATDEGIAPRPSQCGQGACAAAGEVTCQGGRLVDSCDPGDPNRELCNGADDDCDGATDEGIDPRPSQCGQGACAAAGEVTCQGGRLVDSCDPGDPSRELCNGADDDCDGATDEGIDPRPSQCGQGACAAAGEVTCQGGRFVDSCDPGDPSREQCNGQDDDCDGATDEGIAPRPSQCGQGACAAAGEVTCQGGRFVDSCDPGEPGAEVCNAFDDDCDGTADEGIDPTPSECGEGICAARGEVVCVDGEEVDTCLPEPPADEVCNGVDDDCDGEVDEGEAVFAANEYSAAGHAIVMGDFGLAGSTRMHLRDDARLVVHSDGSARLTGTAHVVAGPNPAGQEWAVDVTFAYRGQGPAFGGPKIENAPLQPPAVTDEWHYYDMTAGTLTRPGSHVTLTQMPADGRFPMQLGIAANGKDGDLGLSLWFTWVRRDANGTGCDGHGDFNLDLAPIDIEGCVPEDEICDGIDNDLDGETDEGFGVGEPCRVGVGACADEGTVVCEAGDAVCDAAPGAPAPERCDGIDDDCDGAVDELPPEDSECGVGACLAWGERVCEHGGIVDTCVPGAPGEEECNALDDDCDGVVDEGTQSRQWRVTEFRGGHALWLPGFNRDGNLVTMRLRDDATFLWHIDGTARILGTAYIDSLGGGPGVLGQEWQFELYLRYRGQGDAHGGPKIELPALQVPAVTDLWNYWDIIGARIIRGQELVHFTQRPVDGSFPFQFGQTANGKDNTLGAAVWFDWHRVDAQGRERRGHGDLNVTMHDEVGVCAEVPIDQICVDHCEAQGAQHMQGCLMLGYPRAQCQALLDVWLTQCIMFQCC